MCITLSHIALYYRTLLLLFAFCFIFHSLFFLPLFSFYFLYSTVNYVQCLFSVFPRQFFRKTDLLVYISLSYSLIHSLFPQFHYRCSLTAERCYVLIWRKDIISLQWLMIWLIFCSLYYLNKLFSFSLRSTLASNDLSFSKKKKWKCVQCDWSFNS